MGYWSYKDLFKAKCDLEKIIKQETDLQKKQYMLKVLNSIKQCMLPNFFLNSRKIAGYKKKMQVLENDLAYYKKYYSLVSLFHDITSEYREQVDKIEEKLEQLIGYDANFGVITGATISNHKSMYLTKIFYKQFAPSLYSILEKAFNESSHSIHYVSSLTKDVEANACYFDIIDRYFIAIKKENDIVKLYNTIHEYGHILSYYVNPSALYLKETPMFTEVESIFPEMISRYENVGNYDDIQVLYEEYKLLPCFMGTSINLVLHSPLINLWHEHHFTIKKDFLQDAKELYDLDKKMFKNILDTHIDDDGDYVISYLVCVELLHIYKQNKEKALRIYEEILRLPYTEDLYSFITSKLRLGSHLKEYTEELVTELSIQLKKVN